MMAPLRSCKGFTLIELMVTLALLGLVIAGGFSFYYFADRTFMSGSEMANVQADVQLAMHRITDEVRLAHSLKLITPDEVPLKVEDEDEHYLFMKNGSLYMRTIQSPPDRVLLDSSLSGTDFDVVFGPVDGDSGKLPDMLAISISSDNPQVDYTLTSELQVLNLRKNEIEGTTSGEAILYTKNFSPEEVELGGGRQCPYRRYAYAPGAPELDSLRAFRDNVLAKNPLGRFVIQVYYAASPIVESFLDYQPLARHVTTTFLRSLAQAVIRFT